MSHLKIAIIDFDGTLCQYEWPDAGPKIPEPGVKEALLELKRLGFEIHIHSCRTATYHGRDRIQHILVIQNFMQTNKLPYDVIIIDRTKDKPLSTVYIDDKAVGYRGNWEDVIKQVREME